MAQQSFKAASKKSAAGARTSSSAPPHPDLSIDVAKTLLNETAKLVFRDPRVRSVGISRHGDGFGYRAVRNSAMITPESAIVAAALPSDFDLPITYVDTPHEVEHQLKVPLSGPGAPTVSSHVPEQGRIRPLASGLQIQNYDDDVRTGVIAKGFIIVGTLGCFVDLDNDSVAILSNNHVVAGENRGAKGSDRIQQPGSATLVAGDLVGTLENFIALRPSPVGASVAAGNAILNQVDAGVALIGAGVSYKQGFIPSRSLQVPSGTAGASVGDKVYKVGRTTGLTRGEVKDIATIVGPVGYDPGPCWFEQSLTIEGDNGTMFSDKGDSGSIIVRDDEKIVGLLYAGNGSQTYACPIDLVFAALNCKLH